MKVQELAVLLKKCFSRSTRLRRFLRDALGEEAAFRLPGEIAPDADVFDEAARIIISDFGTNELAKHIFFDKLRTEAPHHTAELNALAGVREGLRRVRVAVVRVQPEDLDPTSVLAKLGGLANVLQGGQAESALLGAPLPEADLLVLLLGPKHGGQLEALIQLLGDSRCRAIRLPFDSEEVSADPEVLALRKSLPKAGPDLPTQVLGLVSDWYQEKFPPTPGGNPTLHPWERRYLEDMENVWRCGEPGGVGVLLERGAKRAGWYVHLRAADRESVVGTPRALRTQVALTRESSIDGVEGASLSPFLDQVLGQVNVPRIAVVGGAGTGKSMLIAHIAWTLCQHHLGLEFQPPIDGPPHLIQLEEFASAGPLVPIPVVCTAATLVAKLKREGRRDYRIIRDALERILIEEIFPSAPPGDLRAGMDGGRYWFLVDSLDEIPLQSDRNALVRHLGALKTARLTITTRPMADAGVGIPDGFERTDIAPLDDERMRTLVKVLLTASGRGASDVQRALNAISVTRRDFPSDSEGRTPAENPLLLTTMTMLWHRYGTLPDDRATLYEWMIRLLCEAKAHANDDERQFATVKYYLEDLRILAFTSQESYGTAMPVSAACDALVLSRRATDTIEAKSRLEGIVNKTGLLYFDGPQTHRVIRPWHRSFQEYLTATAIAARFHNLNRDCIQWLMEPRRQGIARIDDPTWTKTLGFLVGAFGGISNNAAVAIVRAWMQEADHETSREAKLLALAGNGVAEYEFRLFEHEEALKTELSVRIQHGFAARGARWPWDDRLDALEALGRLGDPRLPNPMSVNGLTIQNGWVHIPENYYSVNGDPSAINSLRSSISFVGEFFIRVWPVTVSEFEQFTSSDDFQDERYWADGRHEDHKAPQDWTEQMRHPNRPVTSVDWFTARAFCRWATVHWRIPRTGVLDLPTSTEWDVAARRGTGRVHSWDRNSRQPFKPGRGDHSRAAYDWGGAPLVRRRGAPVGAFPRGYTPDLDGALWDMGGNGWEWCATLHQQDTERDIAMDTHQRSPLTVGEHGEVDAIPRVFRGSSWVQKACWLRAASRYWYPPTVRIIGLGFRVVYRPNTQHRQTDPERG